MKKENIINDLSDKLKMLTEQQEKDKGKQSSEKVFIFSNRTIAFTTDWFWSLVLLLLKEFLFTCVKDLIETLSEDRARLLEEKKKLEEEVNKLRSSNFSPSTYSVAASEACGACAADIPTDTDRLVSDIAAEGRMDSTMETSMMAVQ